MRTMVLVLAICVTANGWSQQTPASKPNRAELIEQLRSDDVQVRSEAFESVRTDAVALRDPKVKAALVNLLDRENHETPSESGEDEGYAEYTAWLADTVAKITDWSRARQVCILANSVDLPDELADHAKVAVPCLLQRYKTVPARFRGSVIATLVQALAKGKDDLDAASIQEIHEIILSALRDPDPNGPKIDAIMALGKFGGEDMIPALKIVAETDSDPSEHYAIRRWAAEAIAAIERRKGQQ